MSTKLKDILKAIGLGLLVFVLLILFGTRDATLIWLPLAVIGISAAVDLWIHRNKAESPKR